MEGCFVVIAFAGLAVLAVPLLVAYRKAAAAEEAVLRLRSEVEALRAALRALREGDLRPARANPGNEGGMQARAAGHPAEAILAAPDGAAPQPAASARGPEAARGDGPGTSPHPRLAAPPVVPGHAAEAGRPLPAASGRPTPRSLETEIGSRWLLFIGATVLVLGFGFFVKHAFENEWISPLMRVLAGGVAGCLLILAGSRFVRRGYALYGQIVTGGGLAILYLSTYAAFAYYDLLARTPTFALMVAITAVAALLADWQRSPGLAVMAVGGGFLTPFLIGSGTDAQVTLFTYDAILVAGTMYLAHRRAWIGLNLLSFVFTVVTIAGWAAVHYRPARYAITEAFLTLFCAMFLFILRATARSGRPSAPAAVIVLAAGPVLFYFSSLALLFPHATALMVFLIGLTVAGIAAGIQYRRPIVRLVTFLLAVLPFFSWLATHTGAAWTNLSLMTLGALYVMHLLAAQEHLRQTGTADGSDVLLFHLNGLTLFLGVYTVLDAVHLASGTMIAAALSAWNLVLAGLEYRRNRLAALHPLALAFTFAAISVALGAENVWITVGWAAEGAAVVWVGLVARRTWFRLGGGLLLALAIVRFVTLDQAAIPVGFTPVLNARVAAGLFIVGLCYLLAYLHAIIGPDERGTDSLPRATLLAAANILTVWMVTVEITAYFRGGLDAAHQRTLGQLATAAAWGLYALGLVAVGSRAAGAAARRGFATGGLVLMLLAVMRLLSAELGADTARFAPIANPYFAVGVLIAGALYVSAALVGRAASLPAGVVHALRLAASILGIVVLTVEVGIFWNAGAVAGRRYALAEQMSVSVVWTVYAMILSIAGIFRRYPPIRYLAIAIFGLAIAKVFLFDLSYLAGIYRVAGFLAVGSVLLLASYLYQRFATDLK